MSEPLPYRNAEEDADERVPCKLHDVLLGMRIALYAIGGGVLLLVGGLILFLAYSLVTAIW